MEINKKRLENRLYYLYSIIKIELNLFKNYKSLYDKYPLELKTTNDLLRTIPFVANIFIYNVINNMGSLLRNKQKNENKKEVSFNEYAELLGDKKIKFQKELKNIWKLYTDDSNLNEIRNNFISHSNLNKDFDADMICLNFFNEKIILKIEKILNKIKLIFKEYTDVPINNSLDILILEGQSHILNLIEKELDNKN